MVTSTSMRNFTWGDGVQVTAQDLRLQAVAARLTGASPSGSTGIAARPGVRYGTGDPLKVAASSGMNIVINAGFVYVQGTVSATAGMYEGCLDTTSALTVTTSDPTNPRIDNVIAKFVDNGDNTSTGTITIQAGTPAASPVAPTLPANSLLLATIAVGAGVSSITAGNVTDGRVWTVGAGGILPMANVVGGISGPAGLYADDLSTGRLKRSDGSGNARAPKIGAFAPATATLTTSSSSISPGSTATILSASITTDGVTEVRIEMMCFSINQATFHQGDWGYHLLQLDGATINSGAFSWVMTANSAVPGFGVGGGAFVGYVTPSAGTHTVSWALSNAGTSTNAVQVVVPGGPSAAQTYPMLRVGPSFN